MKRKKTLRQEVLKFVSEQYGTTPEYPWDSAPSYAVLRHSSNKKWYGLIMDIQGSRLGLSDGETIDIINLKCDPVMSGSMRLNKGIFPGYHMHKGNWISVLLDGTVDFELIKILIESSFDLTDVKIKTRKARAHIANWIVPANPKYYDIEKFISESVDGTFLWKQGRGISAGDTVYLYIAAPVSAILYKCKVTECGIPYRYSDENIRMEQVMRLKLLKRFDKEPINLALLKEHGVNTVRGSRGMPKGLILEIEKIYGSDI